MAVPEEDDDEITIPAAARDGYLPIGAYALIGDTQTAALVANDGAVDWLCLPYFDSPAVFCRILDREIGGFLSIQPATRGGSLRSSRAYRDESNVLETTLSAAGGTVRLTDAMLLANASESPLDGLSEVPADVRLVRVLDAVAGPVSVELEALLSFDYASSPSEVEIVPGRGAIATDGDRFVGIAWPGALRQVAAGRLRGTLDLPDGGRAVCAIVDARSHKDALAGIDPENPLFDELEETDAAWRQWCSDVEIGGPYHAAMRRSALALKLLTFQQTGAVVAAPTTSLPEKIGGNRNWDYRYCWLRDATFTLYAFHLLGDISAAEAFWHWITHTCAGTDPTKLRIMFDLFGRADLTERTLDHLSGYENSRPVRVGNAAAEQFQLDVYGELVDAFHFYYLAVTKAGATHGIGPETWQLVRAVADYICHVWQRPDDGIWEMRGKPRHYVYSKVMCWVGLDRAIALHDLEPEQFWGDVERWRQNRQAIRAEVLDRGFNRKLNSFTMWYGSTALDAALLRLPLVGFLPATDERMRSTIELIESRLGTDGLIRRYGHHVNDGLPPGEGAFAICSFWLIDCLLELGEIDRARDLYDRMLTYGNDVGLFAEEIDITSGAALGNFPQAFTHIGIIDAGVDLTAALVHRRPVGGETARRAAIAKPDHGNGLS